MMERIGIFCSASEVIDTIFFEKANELGVWMGRNKKTLVYGGANLGLMECMAKAVKANGGFVMGVVPTKLEERGAVSDLLDVTFRVDDLSERKDTMLRESDILVALPGGVGTLDEVFHVVASASIGYHSKKIILYNINGFWDGLLTFMDGLKGQGFARRPLERLYGVANSFEELIDLLK